MSKKITESTVQEAKSTSVQHKKGMCPFTPNDIDCQWLSVHHCNVCIHSIEYRESTDVYNVPELIPAEPTPYEVLKKFFNTGAYHREDKRETLLEASKGWELSS